jgi:hypothetical protein
VIGKISTPRGEHVEPLLYYLFGPGRHEEHTDPHIVAGPWRHPASLEPPLRAAMMLKASIWILPGLAPGLVEVGAWVLVGQPGAELLRGLCGIFLDASP